MNDIKSEYLNGNGSNGNGHANGNGNIFNLTPKEDPLLAKVVPAARRKICEDTKISESARMFFCWLTDTSLVRGISSRPGVVHFADSYLAKRFRVSKKTIQNWREALRSTGEVWCTELRMKNCFPKTVYNITCILGQQMPLPIASEGADGDLPEDSIFTSNRFRLANAKHEKGSGKFACRLHGVASCAICRAKRGVYTQFMGKAAPDILQKTSENEPSENILPSTTALDCHPQRQNIAAHNGNELPSLMATNCHEARQPITAHSGNHLPLSAENDCRNGRQTVAVKREPKDDSLSIPKGLFKRSTGDNASESITEVAQLRWEKIFLNEVGEVMDLWKKGHSKFELTNSGAWWRQSFRANRELARKVLAESKCAIVERRIKKDPGSYAVDLWKRWQKILLADAIKQKAVGKAAART